MKEIKNEIIKTKKAPLAIGQYSQAIRAGNLLFLSGQISINPETNEFIDGDIETQTEQVLKNIKAILEAGGSLLEDVVKVTIYLQDISGLSGNTLIPSVSRRCARC